MRTFSHLYIKDTAAVYSGSVCSNMRYHLVDLKSTFLGKNRLCDRNAFFAKRRDSSCGFGRLLDLLHCKGLTLA